MENYNFIEEFDVIVIGAGHAGCEAGLASARRGLKTLLLTIQLDSVALMPCNPSIGGTGKGQLVREIDALGGEMGKNIDATYIQSKMLNTAKGPAVHSLRAQADKKEYTLRMKKVIERTPNLYLKQQMVTGLICEDNVIKGVETKTGLKFGAKAVVIAGGTYINSDIIIGSSKYKGGPNGLMGAGDELSRSLESLGFEIVRLKTGTPARVNKRSLDFSKMEIQFGDSVETIEPFSFENEDMEYRNYPCYLNYTNEKTHEIIRANLHRSPLFGGLITGVGPRYCPSIEDKVVRFADKPRHQMFVEPEGLSTDEVYIQGMSSSLPEDVQLEFMRTFPGFENVEVMRSAYAIEYDAINPMDLKLSLESKLVHGLFTAGQVNGTSGYEEAAAQGIVAGINAANYCQNKEPMILSRTNSYIGVLIDDIVTKGTLGEPYRIMTGRVEYRLILRQDNADQRLTQIGYDNGLVSEARRNAVLRKTALISSEITRLKHVKLSPSDELNRILEELGTSPVTDKSLSIYDLLKRPQVGYDALEPLDTYRPKLPTSVTKQVQIEIKYEDYIEKQLKQVDKVKALEEKRIPEDFDYTKVKNLRTEAVQKLTKYTPHNISQASRISGVSPADINALIIALKM